MRYLKKFLCLVLAIAMVLGMATVSNAADYGTVNNYYPSLVFRGLSQPMYGYFTPGRITARNLFANTFLNNALRNIVAETLASQAIRATIGAAAVVGNPLYQAAVKSQNAVKLMIAERQLEKLSAAGEQVGSAVVNTIRGTINTIVAAEHFKDTVLVRRSADFGAKAAGAAVLTTVAVAKAAKDTVKAVKTAKVVKATVNTAARVATRVVAYKVSETAKAVAAKQYKAYVQAQVERAKAIAAKQYQYYKDAQVKAAQNVAKKAIATVQKVVAEKVVDEVKSDVRTAVRSTVRSIAVRTAIKAAITKDVVAAKTAKKAIQTVVVTNAVEKAVRTTAAVVAAKKTADIVKKAVARKIVTDVVKTNVVVGAALTTAAVKATTKVAKNVARTAFAATVAAEAVNLAVVNAIINRAKETEPEEELETKRIVTNTSDTPITVYNQKTGELVTIPSQSYRLMEDHESVLDYLKVLGVDDDYHNHIEIINESVVLPAIEVQ